MSKKKTEEKQVTEQEAQKILQKAQQERMTEFYREYESLCKKHGFQLKANIQWSVVPMERSDNQPGG